MIMTNRRDFLKQTACIASSSLLMPQFLRANENMEVAKYQGKKLVVIQLNGGNDGLNTFIPYQNDTYYQLRPGTVGLLSIHGGKAEVRIVNLQQNTPSKGRL